MKLMFHTFIKEFEYIQILINIFVDYFIIFFDRLLPPIFGGTVITFMKG